MTNHLAIAILLGLLAIVTMAGVRALRRRAARRAAAARPSLSMRRYDEMLRHHYTEERAAAILHQENPLFSRLTKR